MTSTSVSLKYAIFMLGILAMGVGGFSDAVHGESIGFWNRPCKKAYADWQKRPGHKAFVISGDTHLRGGQTCGWNFGASSKSIAETSALAACRKAQYGGGTCKVLSSQ